MTRCYRCVQGYVYATIRKSCKILTAEIGENNNNTYFPISVFNSKLTTLVSLPHEHGAMGWMRLFVHFIVTGANTIKLPVTILCIFPHPSANSIEYPE